eukprot:XP_020401023.1 circumsporozoite protein-like [Zea mays]
MAHDEEVEDLGDLDSTLREASRVELAPPSDAGEGPSATPAPTGAGEDPACANHFTDGCRRLEGGGRTSYQRPSGVDRAFAGGVEGSDDLEEEGGGGPDGSGYDGDDEGGDDDKVGGGNKSDGSSSSGNDSNKGSNSDKGNDGKGSGNTAGKAPPA